MTEAFVWIRQASSDLQAMDRLNDTNQEELFCQVIAKSQQAVEKSVKALQISLWGKGYQLTKPGTSHPVLPILQSLSRIISNKDVYRKIRGLANINNRQTLERLEALIPRSTGGRNTEYPYQDTKEEWVAPADRGTFDRTMEVEVFRNLAHRISEGCVRIISFLERSP